MDLRRSLLLAVLVTLLIATCIDADLIWHDDEIPYAPKAACARGRSYYTNSIHANNTDIDVGPDVNSLLTYSNLDVCYFCVCATDGEGVGCINRDPWYCDYFRYLQTENAARDTYTNLFEKDVPTYLRTLSYRLRRSMDRGTIDLLEAVGKGLNNIKCIPFASEYTDCTRENMCSGCTKCTCRSDATWSCQDVHVCNAIEASQEETLSSSEMENALSLLQSVFQQKNRQRDYPYGDDDDTGSLFTRRSKRAANAKNGTVTFYETVDELNEDTLKNSNISGTMPAKTVDFRFPTKIYRRKEPSNKTVTDSLHIQFNKPLSNHFNGNKIEETAFHLDNLLERNQHETKNLSKESVKDKELTKLVVNELSRGTEIIGDKNAPSISNITFKAENDTLTAMTFIAGNLLNRLWNMEKDTNDDSVETEILKQEKIADLVQLFKGPLNLKQESVIKNALEKLSDIMSARNPQNVSICEEINQVKNLLSANKNDSIEPAKTIKKTQFKVVQKMNDLLDQLEKFENIKKTIENLKEVKTIRQQFFRKRNIDDIVNDVPKEESPLNVFGDIFTKVTKMLLPDKSAKKINSRINSLNVFKNHPIASEKVKSLLGIDIDNHNLTAKDQFVIDYLNKMENNPGCLMGKRSHRPPPIQKVESDILLNLSEFFKMKSFSDFVQLMNDNRNNPLKNPPVSQYPNVYLSKNDIEHEHVTDSASKTKTSTVAVTQTTESKNDSDFENIKSKLKEHLKALLGDLKEIQNKNMVKSDLHIAAALPCLYKLLESEATNINKKYHTKENNKPKDEIEDDDNISRRWSSEKNISDIVDDIRVGIRKSPNIEFNRRTFENDEISKSMQVWNRVMSNLYKIHSRRKSSEMPQENIEKIIENADLLNSNVFKNMAILGNVHPADHLMLLKTLLADAKKYIAVLQKIKDNQNHDQKSFQNGDVVEFVQNADINLKLNAKVLNALYKLRKNRTSTQFSKLNDLASTSKSFISRGFQFSEPVTDSNPNLFKLTRDQIATQLIKNRLQLYMTMKEANGDSAMDTNYNLAKRVLINIDAGNLKLAKELFKTLISIKEKYPGIDLLDKKLTGMAQSSYGTGQDPFPQFDELNYNMNPSLSYQNALLKQLLNIKNM